MTKAKGWKDIAEGNLIDKPATALEYKTGTWRAFRPIWIKENCIHCRFCWLYCPDRAINIEADKMTGFNYEYCKGCGICAQICPAKPKAIGMMTEIDAKDEAKVIKLQEEKKKTNK
ncbi:MAG: 4Fe-4S binding protein [Lentisphaerae bacterium]|nr:4Fe-4S binding protein [Lentisphaerota bacterium]